MTLDFSRPVALYGGSFDPLHEGHLHVAKEVSRQLPGVQIVFVPAFESPGKGPQHASAEQRLQWAKAAAEPLGFLVWDEEIRRGSSFTVDTLEAAAKKGAKNDSLYWILGADAYAYFPRWKNPARIRELCRLVVVNRPLSPQPARHVPEDILVAIQPHPASSTAVRKGLGENPPKFDYLPQPVKVALETLVSQRKNPYA
jgi:nicotinate-nucleotide adenylyltransferase